MESCRFISLATMNRNFTGVANVLEHGAATKLFPGAAAAAGVPGVPGDGQDSSAPYISRTCVHNTFPLATLIHEKYVHLF